MWPSGVSNLYKLWDRMSSGSYFQPPVRAVFIPKKTGGQRILGVPTVADRVAQMIVKQIIEADLESIFAADSYGYRPGKSALDAIGVTRKRCWKYDAAGCPEARDAQMGATSSDG
jgi:RNA-directed DNA polymerase